MADNSWQSQTRQEPGSAILDMDLEEMQMMDNEGVSSPMIGGNDATKGKGGLFDDMRQRMGENVTQMVWNAGSQGARKAWSVYGNIDILRPYFDVEPKEVQSRLLNSLIPVKRAEASRYVVPRELYGPTMLVFTLIALLLYQMKTAEHKVDEGTLMGTAFGMCFTYWIGTSSFVWFVAYVCNINLAILQVLSMIGYALFGHCIVLFLGTVIHTSHDHVFFYLLWAVLGGLSTARMATIVMYRTPGQRERAIVIGTIATFHLLFLLYLHFAYHTIVEEISDALNENLVPVPVAAEMTNQAAQDVPAATVLAGVNAQAGSLVGNRSSLDTMLTLKPKDSILLGKLKEGSLQV